MVITILKFYIGAWLQSFSSLLQNIMNSTQFKDIQFQKIHPVKVMTNEFCNGHHFSFRFTLLVDIQCILDNIYKHIYNTICMYKYKPTEVIIIATHMIKHAKSIAEHVCMLSFGF